MVAIKFLLAATVCRLATAWPEPTPAANLDNRDIDCSKVTGALSVLKKAGPPATSFCSSFLKIPGTKIATTTFTPSAVTITTSTTTVTVTSAACGQQKRNVPIDYRDVEFTRATNAEVIVKRTDVLALLAAFAAAKVLEGCSCLSLQPKVTKTATQTAPALTIKVAATSTACVVAQPAVCKPNGFSQFCTQNSDCCSGTCGSVGARDCCQPNGGYCDLSDPGACCSYTCFNGDVNINPFNNNPGNFCG